MKHIDANKISNIPDINTDVCIVGAGAAGITIASGLDGSSLDVCLVESGGFSPDEEVQSLYELENVGYPVRESFMSRARYYGGTSNIWPGRCMLLKELDFKNRDWIPNSGWPLSYSELIRYYPKACKMLRLPSYDKFDANFCRQKISAKEESFFQSNFLEPNISMWAKKPLRFGSVYYSKLKKSRNVSVYVNSNVTEIEISDDGSYVKKINISCFNGNSFAIKAKVFVLACGGLENARLLLVSRKKYTAGVGNQYDVVGRYYMDHPRAVFGRVHLYENIDLSRLLGLPMSGGKIQMGIALSEEIQKREGLLNNYLSLETQYSEVAQKTYHSFVQLMKRLLRKGYAGKRFDITTPEIKEIPDLIYLLAPREIIPQFLYRWYSVLKKKRKRDLIVVNYCEQEPNPESRVSLSNKRDRFNMNMLNLNWKIGSAERRSLIRLQELLGEHLKRNKIGFLDNTLPGADELSFTDASHHIGTTRMSDNPKKGVVDKDCKVHGLNNLFLAGSSVFPTSGYANPTLTITALSLRLADHLKRRIDGLVIPGNLKKEEKINQKDKKWKKRNVIYG